MGEGENEKKKKTKTRRQAPSPLPPPPTQSLALVFLVVRQAGRRRSQALPRAAERWLAWPGCWLEWHTTLLLLRRALPVFASRWLPSVLLNRFANPARRSPRAPYFVPRRNTVYVDHSSSSSTLKDIPLTLVTEDETSTTAAVTNYPVCPLKEQLRSASPLLAPSPPGKYARPPWRHGIPPFLPKSS